MIDSTGTISTGKRLDIGHVEGARRRQREQAEAEQRRMQDDRCREAGLHPSLLVLFLQRDEADLACSRPAEMRAMTFITVP